MTSTFIPKNGWTWFVQHTFTEGNKSILKKCLSWVDFHLAPAPASRCSHSETSTCHKWEFLGPPLGWPKSWKTPQLVGGWTNPSDKYAQVKVGSSSPIFGVLKKHIWNDTKKWPYSKGENIFPRPIILGIQPLVFVGVNPPPKQLSFQ